MNRIGELLLLSCRSTHRRLPSSVITARWTGSSRGGLIRALHLGWEEHT